MYLLRINYKSAAPTIFQSILSFRRDCEYLFIKKFFLRENQQLSYLRMLKELSWSCLKVSKLMQTIPGCWKGTKLGRWKGDRFQWEGNQRKNN